MAALTVSPSFSSPLARLLLEVFAFVTAYLLVDWVTYLHPLHGLNLTPWNPAPALGLVYLLRRGWGRIPVLFLAIVLAEACLREGERGLALVLANGLLLTLGYGGIAGLLHRQRNDSIWFHGRQSLIKWAMVIVGGSLANGAVLVAWLVQSGQVPSGEWASALFRFWVGDSVGMGVAMPLVWWLSDAESRRRLWQEVGNWETLAYLLLGALSLGLTFGLAGEEAYKYCYFLFVPIAWAAARQGMAGALVSTAMIQPGIILAAQILGFSAASLLEIQLLILALALVGFFVGVVVHEQRQTSLELRHSLRLAAAGEMAAALAHELNQPLMALAAYNNACQQLMALGETGPRLKEAVERMQTEASRAGAVVKRLRDFFRTGATQLESISLQHLLRESLDRHAVRARQLGVDLVLEPCPALQLVADRLQLEMVLHNLLANALDAVAGKAAGQVRLGADSGPGRELNIRVEDNGPGIPGDANTLFEPFVTTKSNGMGLGLAISRAMAEAHGGQLRAVPGPRGLLILTLPLN